MTPAAHVWSNNENPNQDYFTSTKEWPNLLLALHKRPAETTAPKEFFSPRRMPTVVFGLVHKLGCKLGKSKEV